MASRTPSQRVLALLVGLGAIALLAACVHVDPPRHRHGVAKGVNAAHGPPPHAPAHGYRHRLKGHGGIQIAFDSGIGVYAVVGHDGLFFWRDHFYRWYDSGWQISAHLERGFVRVATAKLPGRLAKKHAGRGHGHPHKHHPAKRRR